MHSNYSDKTGLIIWLYTPKYVNRLKKFGILHYVSKKMNYAVLYVENSQKDDAIHKMNKEHFVRDIENSHTSDWDTEFDGVLERVEAFTAQVKSLEKENKTNLLTHFEEESEDPFNFDFSH